MFELLKLLFRSRKGQLGIIEGKFFLYGLVAGIVLAVLLVYLANSGVLPFKISALCPAAAPAR